jgi:hypothetical protein
MWFMLNIMLSLRSGVDGKGVHVMLGNDFVMDAIVLASAWLIGAWSMMVFAFFVDRLERWHKKRLEKRVSWYAFLQFFSLMYCAMGKFVLYSFVV